MYVQAVLWLIERWEARRGDFGVTEYICWGSPTAEATGGSQVSEAASCMAWRACGGGFAMRRTRAGGRSLLGRSRATGCMHGRCPNVGTIGPILESVLLLDFWMRTSTCSWSRMFCWVASIGRGTTIWVKNDGRR